MGDSALKNTDNALMLKRGREGGADAHSESDSELELKSKSKSESANRSVKMHVTLSMGDKHG